GGIIPAAHAHWPFASHDGVIAVTNSPIGASRSGEGYLMGTEALAVASTSLSPAHASPFRQFSPNCAMASSSLATGPEPAQIFSGHDPDLQGRPPVRRTSPLRPTSLLSYRVSWLNQGRRLRDV